MTHGQARYRLHRRPPTPNRRPSLRLETVSTVEAAANALRELILDGQLEPGARLRETEFAERLGIARHSFRAATQILVSEGLLHREPNRGVQVPVFAPDDLIDVFRLRTALEVEAVRLVVAGGEVPAAAEEAVRELSGASGRRPVAGGGRTRHALSPRDHRRRRLRATGRAYATVQSEVLLCLVWLRPHYDRPAQVAAEHEELIAAVRDGDADRAETLFRAHLKEAAENLTEGVAGADRRAGGGMSAPTGHRARRARGARLPRAAHRPGRARARGRDQGTADVPSGRSTGSAEAAELRDGGRRFGGFGVLEAVANVNGELREALVGRPLAEQRALDLELIELDGTERKSRLGANAILGVSLAAARARAAAAGAPLYRHLNANAHVLPVPLVNLINGGRHASNDLDFQEFIVIPVGADSILEALQISTEVNLALGEILLERYGKSALNTGDEGGYAPAISSPREALALLHEAVANAGHEGRFRYGLDCAATHSYDRDSGTYEVAGERRDADAMTELYLELIRDYDVVTIEDPLDEEDFDGFAALTEASGIQIVGDDLFVTNSERLRAGIERGAANSLLWKVNQIGTLSEAFDAAELAHRSGYSVVVSERSGETEDAIIADLAVALGSGQIKTGAPVRGERTAKYNRLIRIAEDLGGHSRLPGRRFRGGGRRREPDRHRPSPTPRRSPVPACVQLRELALRVAAAGLDACDVGKATEDAVALTPERPRRRWARVRARPRTRVSSSSARARRRWRSPPRSSACSVIGSTAAPSSSAPARTRSRSSESRCWSRIIPSQASARSPEPDDCWRSPRARGRATS